MLKTTLVAVVSSLATAMLLGIALANPQQEVATRHQNVQVKLEWVQAAPKVSESLTVSVDDGRQASVTRPMMGNRGSRRVTVTPTVAENGRITLNIHIQTDNVSSQSLDTVVTMREGETKVISAVSTKGADGPRGAASEELVFATPTLE